VKACGEYVQISIVEDSPRASPGDLTLTLHPICYIAEKRVRRTWSDGKRQRAENCLNAVILWIIRIARAQRRQQAKWASWETGQQAEEEATKTEAWSNRARQSRLDQINTEVTNWREAADVRAYVAAVRTRVSNDSAKIEGRQRIAKWLLWAEAHVEALDPLSEQNLSGIGITIEETDSPVSVRPALPEDYDQIVQLVQSAYGNPSATGRDAVKLAAELRESGGFDHELSLVAIKGAEIIGHALFSNVGVKGLSGLCGVALAPFCVARAHQERTIGSDLVEAGIEGCKELGKDFIVAQGDPDFFQRFDFVAAPVLGVETPFDSVHAMVLELTPGVLSDRNAHIEYPRPWNEPVGE